MYKCGPINDSFGDQTHHNKSVTLIQLTKTDIFRRNHIRCCLSYQRPWNEQVEVSLHNQYSQS